MNRALEDIAVEAVRLALQRGAGAAECSAAEGDEFSCTVRMRQLESVKESGSRGAGLRVLFGRKSGSAYTSDLSPEGVARMVEQAVEIASITSEDPYAGLPEKEELGQLEGDLQLYHEDVAAMDAGSRIRMAREAEEAALDLDPRINNSEGASFGSQTGYTVFANSLGFLGSYRSSSCSLSVIPVARQDDSMERDYWFSIARTPSALESPRQVGTIAAQRVLRRLGARKVPTRKAPVVFEPRVARSLVGHIFEAVHGEAVYRKASFLAGKIGERVAADSVTVIDDGTLPGLFGTCPFDDEGVASRRTVVVSQGRLESYLLNTYTARKLGLKTTGNASRGASGSTGVGHGNLYLAPGQESPESIIRSVKDGFYVTELMGFGVNIVTGDYSRGAAGLWIENGELAYPVAEVTIAGNLKDMWMGIEAVGNDLEFRGSLASPTLLIGEMTISGQ